VNTVDRRKLIALDGLAAFGYLLLLAPSSGRTASWPAWAATLLMLAVGVPVAVRRLWPVPVFLVVAVASVGALVVGALVDPFLAASYALYPVALNARRVWLPTAVPATLAALVLGLSAVVGTPYAWHRWGIAVLGAGLLAASWTAGRILLGRRADAARSAAELAGRAVAEERLRIARDLHDVVAHSMSLIAVKAGTANHVVAARPEEAQHALQVIEATSRTALAEMRHLLGVLRSGSDDSPQLRPAPGLDGLAALASQAGLPVELDVRGAERLPDGVGLHVYRIVQEALTNVVRHAGAARCRIAVIAKAGEVSVEVTDDGAGAGPAGGSVGHGLIGMRERVLMYGGSFSAGPRPEGGFGVSACLPFEP
jgi:signal transduction histidine kinase